MHGLGVTLADPEQHGTNEAAIRKLGRPRHRALIEAAPWSSRRQLCNGARAADLAPNTREPPSDPDRAVSPECLASQLSCLLLPAHPQPGMQNL